MPASQYRRRKSPAKEAQEANEKYGLWYVLLYDGAATILRVRSGLRDAVADIMRTAGMKAGKDEVRPSP